jgi:NAD(P)-dependent dehydrogenase (short-subunit alcohol dehydrogenase family)
MSVAIVTGGSRGLGKALTEGLLDRGWTVVTDARHAADLKALATELGEPDQLVTIAGDVTDEQHLTALVTAARAAGRLDLVVNNAGGLGPSPLPRLADYPLDDLVELFAVNVVAPLRLIQLTLPLLRESGGAVIDITSDAGRGAYEGWGGYGATKAALEQASNVLAVEEPRVRVYWVDPGDLRTQMHQDAFPGEDISDRPLPEISVPGLIALAEEQRPSGRYTVAEVPV